MMRKRPFFWIMLLFATGILVQVVIRLPIIVSSLAVLVCLAGAWRFSRQPFMGSVFYAICLVALGGLYGWSFRKFPADHIHYQRDLVYGRDITVAGMIVSGVRMNKGWGGTKTVFSLDLHELQCQGMRMKTSGKVRVNLYQPRGLEYGDLIILEGKLHRPYEFSSLKKFSYRRYLAQRGIYWILSVAKHKVVKVMAKDQGHCIVSAGLRLRKRLEECFSRHLTEKEAGLMQAIILGDRSCIPGNIYDLFKKTGTAHVLAISGLHVGIVAALFFMFLKILPLNRKIQILLTIILLSGYAVMTGARPSVVRATIMAAVFLLSFVLERETDSLNSLSLAGFILLLMNPMSLFDIGFQLSFASVCAIILLCPVVWRFFQRFPVIVNNKMLKFICQALSASLAAWVGVSGFIAYYFGIITPVTILANILVIPLISAIVALGFGLLVSGYFPCLAGCFAVCIKILLNLILATVYMIERIPGAYFYLFFSY